MITIKDILLVQNVLPSNQRLYLENGTNTIWSLLASDNNNRNNITVIIIIDLTCETEKWSHYPNNNNIRIHSIPI